MRLRKVVAATLALGLAGALSGCESVTVSTAQALTVGASGAVSVPLNCGASGACRGSVRLRINGTDSPFKTFDSPSKSSSSVSVQLTSAQLEAVRAGQRVGEVRLKENAPVDLAIRSIAVQLSLATPLESVAYRDRNWTPTSVDTCPAALHKKFSVIGPDGKIYPTWHPPVVTDPSTGKPCTFGHEHGDDPATSNIYSWVTDFLNADRTGGRGVPFGYVNEALDAYSAATGGVSRHEDHVGNKVIVENDVKLVAKSPRQFVKAPDGSTVTCDFLMKSHQGTHSQDALSNNAHELLFAMRCSDGAAMIASTLSRFGNANEFNRSCDKASVQVTGSNLPTGEGGARLIPDRFCIDRDVLVLAGRPSSIWALYELWQSENQIVASDGSVIASYDPWFGVRNPARAYQPDANPFICNLIDVSDFVDPADGGTANNYPFSEVEELEESTGAELLKGDIDSPFNGAQRDFYLHTNLVDNAGGQTVWFSNPWGKNAAATPKVGAVRQFVSSTAAVWPELERRSFDLERDFGADNGVHAPN